MTANARGPARSPAVLEIPSPFSAKVEAHWLTDCSPAPAHTIMTIRTQNSLLLNRPFSPIPFSPSSISGAMGTLVKTNALPSGRSAQISARILQFPIPAILKNSVDISTTPAYPQQ